MRRLPGFVALALIVAVVGLALAGLTIAGGSSDFGGSWVYIRRVVVLSLGQAAQSTVLSLARLDPR